MQLASVVSMANNRMSQTTAEDAESGIDKRLVSYCDSVAEHCKLIFCQRLSLSNWESL